MFVFTPFAAFLTLAICGLLTVVVLLLPSRNPDPQRGMAVGCLQIVLAALAVVAGVLALAVWQEWTWLSDTICAGVTYFTLLMGLGAVKALYDRIRGRRRRPSVPGG